MTGLQLPIFELRLRSLRLGRWGMAITIIRYEEALMKVRRGAKNEKARVELGRDHSIGRRSTD